MTLLAIDPGRSYKGEASIGYALFFYSALPPQQNGWTSGTISFEDLVKALDFDDYGLWWGREEKLTLISEVVIEDFINDPKSARGGQRNGTSECIGAVEYVCLKVGVPFTRQRSSDLGPAKLHAGYTQTLKHLPHQDSAYLHGYEYLVRKGVLQPKGLSATL